MTEENLYPAPLFAWVGVYPKIKNNSWEEHDDMRQNVIKSIKNFSWQNEMLLEGLFASYNTQDPYKNSVHEMKSYEGTLVRFPRVVGNLSEEAYNHFQNTPLAVDCGIYFGDLGSSKQDWHWVMVYPERYTKIENPGRFKNTCFSIADAVEKNVLGPFYNSRMKEEPNYKGGMTYEIAPSFSAAKRDLKKQIENPEIDNHEKVILKSEVYFAQDRSPEETRLVELSLGMPEENIAGMSIEDFDKLIEEKDVPYVAQNIKVGGDYLNTDIKFLLSKKLTDEKRRLEVVGIGYSPQWLYRPIDSREVSDTLTYGFDQAQLIIRSVGLCCLNETFRI